jgi:hypothetical protein
MVAMMTRMIVTTMIRRASSMLVAVVTVPLYCVSGWNQVMVSCQQPSMSCQRKNGKEHPPVIRTESSEPRPRARRASSVSTEARRGRRQPPQGTCTRAQFCYSFGTLRLCTNISEGQSC